jgi:hypothetical protein
LLARPPFTLLGWFQIEIGTMQGGWRAGATHVSLSGMFQWDDDATSSNGEHCSGDTRAHQPARLVLR